MIKRNKSSRKTASEISREIELFRFNIAGVQYGDYQDAVNLKRGDKLNLFWERSNANDPNAIRIETVNGIKLGYVPARISNFQEKLHSLREEGIKVKPILSAVNKTNPTWTMFTVKVMVSEYPKIETGEYRF